MTDQRRERQERIARAIGGRWASDHGIALTPGDMEQAHRLADAAIAADDLPARVEALAKEWEDAAKRFEERLYRDDAEALRGHAADLRNLLDDPTTGRRS